MPLSGSDRGWDLASREATLVLLPLSYPVDLSCIWQNACLKARRNLLNCAIVNDSAENKIEEETGEEKHVCA